MCRERADGALATMTDGKPATMVVDVDRVGHLGVCIGLADDGRAVLVRHALPGERVRVEITESKSSFLRADAVEVLTASPHRVPSRCPSAGPGRCGGCDWQHVALDEQRRLKATVVAEQLRRLAGLDLDVVVEPVPGDADGLAWRSRLRLAVDRGGVAGLRRHRSRTIERIADCPIAMPSLDLPAVLSRQWRPGSEIDVPSGDSVQFAAGRSWRVPAGGFWQVHPGAASLFIEVIGELLAPLSGERLVDLYGGVGLFAGALVAAHGLGPSVLVEGSHLACEASRANVADLSIRVVEDAVEDWVFSGGLTAAQPDLIVLDPPRRGAGAAVMAALASTSARAVVYVACDPSALARDAAAFAARGWALSRVRAFDAFPMTAHVETIALFEPLAAE